MRHSKLNTGRARRLALAVGAAGALVAGTIATLAPTASAGSTSAGVLADGPVGFAAQNGGTTGGFGGSVVNEYVLSEYTASSGAASPGDAMYELLNAHQDHPGEGLVIYVDQTVSASNFSGSKMDVKDVENVSILGVGDKGEFNGVGFNLARAHNIVIRNLTIHHVDTGDKDGIGIQSASTNIWIDHNEIYNQYQGVDKDYYDGLIDLKDQSKYITVSWNYLHDSWKAMLTASSDSADKAGDNITYMNNHFKNVNSRLPLIRYSHVHVLNNFYEDILGSAVNSRMGAQVLVEGNYFLRTGSGNPDDTTGQIEGPVGWWYGSDTGYWNLVNNTFDDSPHDGLTSTTNYTVPYGYTALSPSEAKTQTTQSAGAGVINVTP